MSGTQRRQTMIAPEGEQYPKHRFRRSNVLIAVEHIRRMRGGSQAQLLRGSDGNYYVVKFPNNPQGTRILVNELICARLANYLGLPSPGGEVIVVPQELIELTSEMNVQMPKGRYQVCAGPCFGSPYVGHPQYRQALTLLPESDLRNAINIVEFSGMLLFDLWTCNTDGRQVVFNRTNESGRYSASMIDNGFCFNGPYWDFPDSHLRGIYSNRIVYESVEGMDSFEPWLSRIESQVHDRLLIGAGTDVPVEWQGTSLSCLPCLLARLCRRRRRIRELLWSLAKANVGLFPNWPRGLGVNSGLGGAVGRVSPRSRRHTTHNVKMQPRHDGVQ